MSTPIRRRESHGNHHMSVVAFVSFMLGFAFAALWLVAMASGETIPAIVFAALMVAAFGLTTVIFMTLARSHHHSPILPDSTDSELKRYFRDYRSRR